MVFPERFLIEWLRSVRSHLVDYRIVGRKNLRILVRTTSTRRRLDNQQNNESLRLKSETVQYAAEFKVLGIDLEESITHRAHPAFSKYHELGHFRWIKVDRTCVFIENFLKLTGRFQMNSTLVRIQY